MKYVIIGSGIAAYEAVLAIRQKEPEAEITMFTDEEVLPYRRPALPKLLCGDLAEQQFFLKPAAFYQEQRIEIVFGSELYRIDRDRRELSFSNGETARYDKLLLAVGGHSYIPRIPGIDLEGVCVLRNHDDVLHIRKLAQAGHAQPLIIGGGLLGLELADSMRRTPCGVTIVEGLERLLPQQLTPAESTAAATRICSEEGLRLYLGSFPTELLGRTHVEKVRLANGTELESRLVIFSTGMRPNTLVATESGLATTKAGITVDEHLTTSDPAIFAAGDCAAVNGQPAPGLYLPARDMGAAAGRAMTGDPTPFTVKQYAPRMQALGLQLVNGKLSVADA